MNQGFVKFKPVAAAALLSLLLAGAGGCDFGEKQYTILLHTFTGPEHVHQARLYRDKTKEMSGWSGLEVVHKDSNSELYWGKYSSMDSARSDLETARTWRAGKMTRAAFPFPRIVIIPGMDPGNPAYKLQNAPPGYWTLLVALYVDDKTQGFVGRDRQKHAMEYCDFLRKKGYDAYYHHVPGRTKITVGVFHEDAVVVAARPTGKPDEFTAKRYIRDDKLQKLMKTLKPPLAFLVVNDHTEYERRISKKTGKPIKAIVASHPIPIPGRKRQDRGSSRSRRINPERPINVPQRNSSGDR